MADESKAPPAPPLRGMIKIDGEWQVRRFGLLVQRQLTCIYGHKMSVGGRPFEIAIPCLNAGAPRRFDMPILARCEAHVTRAESETIDQHSMDVEAIITHFGVGFPVDMKITRTQ